VAAAETVAATAATVVVAVVTVADAAATGEVAAATEADAAVTTVARERTDLATIVRETTEAHRPRLLPQPNPAANP
jgi:hypothetical protein